uniref:hypothetical protein n=1 Tax=Alistipes sp. TaxID=1872444 RepID=UPI004055FB1E
MKKSVRYLMTVILGATMTLSCQQDELFNPDVDNTPDGYKTIEFLAQVPDMKIVQTRAVDPDGGGVQRITVFCFDENDLFITTVTAKNETDGIQESLKGKFKVSVPDHAVTLQLVGNQQLDYFNEDRYRGMSEVDVMAALEASPGRMIYWARKTVDELSQHNTTNNPVILLRNQAKITLNVDSEKSSFVQKGWVVVNSNAFGTVAPYNSDYGGFVPPSVDRPFVTLPENNAKLKDFLDVRTNDVEYIFETENTESDPIDFILKGSNGGGEDLYYRISLLDENGNNVMIMRNHHYTVNIVGDLYYGQTTFEAALEAPATNNVWVSVSDNISEVMDSEYRLSVDNTSVVIGEAEFKTPNTYYLHYTLESRKGEALTEAQVSWMDNNNVALHAFTHTFDPAAGRGTIEITLNQMGEMQKREGTLYIKKGRLSRKIKVVTVKEQTFEPAWITTNIYGVGTGENVTMMFTIPDECPQELFPMNILISVNDLDIRNESGMRLPIIKSGEEGYGADNGIGYKYVLTVNETGKQSVYLETILEQSVNSTIDVTIEAKHFEALTKTATFQSEVNQYILLHNLRSYSAQMPADEVIYYYLVPQKINAVVDFPTHLGKDIVWNDDHTVRSYTAVTPGENDEFLIYSQFLNHDESRTDLDFTFYPISSDLYSTGGRVYGFKRNMDGSEGEGATYHMITNTPKSAEVVRIASNPVGSLSVTGSGELCTGAQYRSTVFELANFHPFHFAAQINGNGTVMDGQNEEVVDIVQLDYLPNQPVNISFDVTSFLSSIQGVDQSEQESVDPFGTAFDIYIDAPMLNLDESSDLYASGKVERDQNVAGRFIYHVSKDRDEERALGTASALVSDPKADGGQDGERKTIAFKTSDIVTAGEITISADESKVVYYIKKFKIQNSSITGVLRYRNADDELVNVPSGSFVPFEVMPTFNRIGVISVGENGAFELRLRQEYKYDWNTDNVKFQFRDANGVVYESEFSSLNNLYSTLENGTPITLEEPQD